jgi:hypothetical protein
MKRSMLTALTLAVLGIQSFALTTDFGFYAPKLKAAEARLFNIWWHDL